MNELSILEEKVETERFNLFKSQCGDPKLVSRQFYINNNLHLEMMIHIGRLIFPEFIVVHDLVFIKEFINSKNIRPNVSSLGREEYQSSFNRLNLAQYFHMSVPETNDDIFIAAQEIIKHGWECSLTKLFPAKEFVIMSSNEDGYDPYVWFYQKQT